MKIKDTRKKNERQQLILDIIKNRQVSSQEELVNALGEHGIRVTQATLSRDIKKLHITKVSTADNRYVYIVPNSNDITDTLLSANRGPANPNHSVGFESLTFSGNIAVVKTRNGYASGLAYDIDMSHTPEILGTIAGADTIFLVMSEDVSREKAREVLSRFIPIDK